MTFEERQAEEARDREQAAAFLDMLAGAMTVDEFLAVVRLFAGWAAKKMREDR